MKRYLKEQVIPKFIDSVREFDDDMIEDAMIALFKGSVYSQSEYAIIDKFNALNINLDMEILIYIFEALLEDDSVLENGIVFTPAYIASYINKNIMIGLEEWSPNIKIIDPGCGCGIFLIQAIEFIKSSYGIKVKDIVVNNIYGIDLNADNVRRCKKILNMLVELDGDKIEPEDIKILNEDSLKKDWNELFSVSGFDYVIGNPPYVNTHYMSSDTINFLKNNFETTKSGVFNIFYAFIEQGMKFLNNEGKLSYIVPNNFLTIKSALELRSFMQKSKSICEIIDFAENMVFKPVRTYNCIIVMDKKQNEKFKYAVLNRTDDMEEELNSINFNDMSIKRLDKNGWNLVDKNTYDNLLKIENQVQTIKDFVRTGIATLKDDVYMVNSSNEMFYKDINGVEYEIEREIVKKIYKIPDLKKNGQLSNVCRYIIFPYQQGENGLEIIPERKLVEKYPNTYKYLVKMKSKLDARDKGKENSVAWYAYGRTQGLSKFGRKLLFPTFSNIPKFMLVEDETALFCNGYGVFENSYLELEELVSVLNSKVMEYYVQNTSYAIEGGYYCYQKKYIERFSIPLFSEDEKKLLRCGSKKDIDEMLIEKYELAI